MAKNSSTATMRSVDGTGTAIAAPIPTSRAKDSRTMPVSDLASSIHTSSLLAQAMPGRPAPGSKVNASLRSVNGASGVPEADQAAPNSRYAPDALIQACPSANPPYLQSRWRTAWSASSTVRAASTENASSRAIETSSWMRLRSVTSWQIPKTRTGRPSRETTSPRACSIRTDPSRRTARYSYSSREPVRTALAISSTTRSRSSGWTRSMKASYVGANPASRSKIL